MSAWPPHRFVYSLLKSKKILTTNRRRDYHIVVLGAGESRGVRCEMSRQKLILKGGVGKSCLTGG